VVDSSRVGGECLVTIVDMNMNWFCCFGVMEPCLVNALVRGRCGSREKAAGCLDSRVPVNVR
jgi:hypothetical protein